MKKFVICPQAITCLENQYGAYVLSSNEWYRFTSVISEFHIPYARATLCHDRPIRDPAVIIFFDPDHPLTPSMRAAFDGIVLNGKISRLSKWIAQFRH